jgi:hypothetical protein
MECEKPRVRAIAKQYTRYQDIKRNVLLCDEWKVIIDVHWENSLSDRATYCVLPISQGLDRISRFLNAQFRRTFFMRKGQLFGE